MKSQSKKVRVTCSRPAPLPLMIFAAVVLAVTAILAPAASFAEPPKTVRPASEFQIVLPHHDLTKLFEDKKMVMVNYGELRELIERNNRLVGETFGPGGARREKAPPADHVISSASYRVIKDRENVLCSVDIDFSILAKDRFVLIPLFEGEMAMTDAVVDDTLPIMIVEPSPGRGGQQYQLNQNDIQIQAVQSMIPESNVNQHIAMIPPSKNARNRYSLLARGAGNHQLNIRFLLTPAKDGATYSLSFGVPRAPKNSLLFLHDERDAIVKLVPSIGARSFTHPETKNQAFEAEFGFADIISLSYFTISREEKKMLDDAKRTSESAQVTGEALLADTAEITAPAAKYEEEAPAVSCGVRTVFSVGDGVMRGNHEITFNIIKGKISRFSFDVPAGTDIEDVISDNYEKRQIQEFAGHSSVEIFLKTPAASEFTVTLTSLTRIEDDKYEVTLPEISFHGVESERGHIAICALTNIRIAMAGEPFNLERLDAQELPDRIKYSVISPILYALKYYKHPYRAKLALTKYSDSKVLSGIIRNSSINTILTAQGVVISSFDLGIKNNGFPFLKMAPEDTLEILDSSVGGKPVKASYDDEANLKIPIVKSSIVNEDVVDFPVSFKTSASTKKFGDMGNFDLSLPKVDLPIMAMKWRVFTPDGYVFYNIKGNPDLKMPAPQPLIYQVPANVISGVARALRSDHFLGFAFVAFVFAIFALLAYVAYVGGEKVYKSNLVPAAGSLLKAMIGGTFSLIRNHAISIVILFLIGGLLAAISVPNYNRARSQGKKKACISNMKSIEGALELYQIENGTSASISVAELSAKGYLKSVPRCPSDVSYSTSTRVENGARVIDVMCEVHGNLSLQETLHKNYDEGTRRHARETGQYDKEVLFNRVEPRGGQANEAPSAPPAASIPMEAAKSEAGPGYAADEDKADLYLGNASVNGEDGVSGKIALEKKVESAKPQKGAYKKAKDAKRRPAQVSPSAEKGIFSVPVKLPKTSFSNLVERQFIAPNESVDLSVSYLSVRLFKTFGVILFLLALALPYSITRTVEAGGLHLIALPASIAIIAIAESANSVLPATGWYSQFGLLCGVTVFAILKLIAYITDPTNVERIGALISQPAAAPAAGPSPNGGTAPSSASGTEPKKDGGPHLPNNTLPLVFFAIFLAAAIILAAVPAFAAPGDGARKKIDLVYNPATEEIKTFHLVNFLDAESKADRKIVFMSYDELDRLINAVNAMQYMPDSKEASVLRPPYKSLIKKISISGTVGTETAALDIDYFIDTFDEDYTTVDLFSGNVAMGRVESFLVKPFNFGFYEMSGRQIDRLEAAYGDRAHSEKFAQYRQNRPFEKVSEYKAFKMSPDRNKYSAMFENPGEYLVRVSIKTPVIFSENAYYFSLSPQKAPCMRITLRTPPEYDVLAENLIIESQARDTAENALVTKGSLIPDTQYAFKLSLAEEVRRERLKKQREEEEKARIAREKLIGKTDEVRVITKKVEPRITLTSAERLTVDEERFAATLNLSYNIQNTELRELSFQIPATTMITQVENQDVYDWKVRNDQSSENRILDVLFRVPQQGRVDLRIGFEHEIANIKVPATIPWLRPVGVHEHRGYIAVDSAINAEVSTTNEVSTNLVAIDEREIPDLPKGYASSPVLYSYKFTKPPANLALTIKKHIDVASIPCAIDVASYRTFITKEGYAITRAAYNIRNNNVQFLELRLPKGSTTWSLKVGERLTKPGAGPNDAVFVPLIKSPLENNEFKAFQVELVYYTKYPELAPTGRVRFELPRVGVICSRVSWDFFFIEDGNVYNVSTNLRQETSAYAPKFADDVINKTLSVNDIVNIQSRKMKTSVTNASGLEAQSVITTRDLDHPSPATGPSFGGVSRGMLPVPIGVPATSNALYFSGESLERADNIEATSVFYVEFSYYSKGFYAALSLAGYLLGMLSLFAIIRAFVKKAGFKRAMAVTVAACAYASAIEYLSQNSSQFVLLGAVMAITAFISYKLVRLSDEELKTLKLK